MKVQPGPADAANADFFYLEEVKRRETLKALEALSDARRHALFHLQRAQVLFTYLNWKQREFINSRSGGNFFLEKIYALPGSSRDSKESKNLRKDSRAAESEEFTALVPAGTANSVRHMAAVRKNILLFATVQARAAELIEAITKSTAVFNRQHRAACRELFPFGFISRWRRSIRRFFNGPYFSWQDMGCLQNLGMAAGFVLKMAEAPIVRGRQ